MVEVHPGLFVGNQADYEVTVKQQPGWRVVHACKEPYHRLALGYTGRAAPKTHPEYLLARRGDRLILNLVDADNPSFFSPAIFDAAGEFIRVGLAAGMKVLVHCNQGESRGPGVALYYLAGLPDCLPDDFSQAESAFRAIYPRFNPSLGVRGFLVTSWPALRARLAR